MAQIWAKISEGQSEPKVFISFSVLIAVKFVLGHNIRFMSAYFDVWEHVS